MWHNDGMRIYLDPDYSQSAAFGIEDRQYRFLGKDDRLREGTQRDRYMEGVEFALGDQPSPRKWERSPQGWVLEMSYPWETLGVEPEAGKRMGLDVVVQDSDEGMLERAVWAAKDLNDAGEAPIELGTLRLVRQLESGSLQGYLPPQIWKEEDGVVVIEAEQIDHHSHWTEKTEPSGFTGQSYLL